MTSIFDVILTLNSPWVTESSCALCGGVFKTIYRSVMLYTSKDGKTNMFSDDI